MTGRAEVGVLIVVHGDYGAPLVAAAEVFVGPLNVSVTMVCQLDEREGLRQRILRQIGHLDQGRGVLMLADLCGSTPANCCIAITQERPDCEVVTGLNLPMLMKLATCDRHSSAQELARELQETAKRCIITGSARSSGGGKCGG